MPRLLASSGGDVVIRQRCRGYWHHLAVMRLFAAIISREGIQPERLNAEGFSPSALSRGWSVSVTPGIPSSPRKASERRESSCRGSRYSRSSHHVGRHITEGYASLYPRLRATRFARAFDLSGRAAVIGCVGIQPERLNAEGDSPSALSRGLSVSATPGTIAPKEKPLEDAKAAAEEADIRVLRIK